MTVDVILTINVEPKKLKEILKKKINLESSQFFQGIYNQHTIQPDQLLYLWVKNAGVAKTRVKVTPRVRVGVRVRVRLRVRVRVRDCYYKKKQGNYN